MESWELDGLRSANYGMRNQVDHIMDALAEQRTQIAAVQEQLTTVRATATSSDGLVEVTVDSGGVLTEVKFGPKALQAKPEDLGRSVTEAGQAAARLAQQRNAEIIAPIAAATDAMPDLPDLVPGAPSLRELARRDREQD
ncbi:YbaB/EbfC family nucleoid-associated protein [Nocardia sp. NBC_00565]|uniref:YbaB/EbfC family nucleoid-associated protein n=1 Tax=Nocardia sp. NBC_00565 TaxID=2975993 RepID=UPI002E821EB7|nr:YbaB/EbfC family nucleoid-associated protein [Nocardia sp. NBC_00565]WUC07695.1 YbaB/EbfC family nucleoid-associated protein [Nocardia sp. NBC_00565]